MHLRRIATRAASLASLALAAAGAQAHNLWLLPSNTVLSKPEWVTFDAAASTRVFESDHVGLSLDPLVATAPDGTALPVQNPVRGKLRSAFDLHLTQQGTYRVAWVNDGLTASYKDAQGQARRWRGKPAELALPAGATDVKVTESMSRVESFVTVGTPTAVSPSGKGLEMVAATHPNDLVRGEQARFTLMLDGRPAPGIEVTAVRGGLRFRDKVGEIKATTDAAGRFGITWPEAGMFYLEATASDGKTTVPRATERRLVYAATLEVLP